MNTLRDFSIILFAYAIVVTARLFWIFNQKKLKAKRENRAYKNKVKLM